MDKSVDLRGFGTEESCEDVREVASRIGVQVVCNDEEEPEKTPEADAMHLKDDEYCEETKEVASRFGVQVVCDDEE